MADSKMFFRQQVLGAFPELQGLNPEPETAVIAVGIGVLNSGEPSTRSRECALWAQIIYNADLASYIYLLSVNKNSLSGVAEAEAMRSVLTFPNAAIIDPRELAEDERDNTILNMLQLRREVKMRGWKRVILCAHIHHAGRVRLTAEWALQDLEVEVIVLGVPAEYDAEATGWFEKSWSFQLREIFATLCTHVYITFAKP